MSSDPIAHLILDRDGVLNVERAAPVASIADWEWERGVVSALRSLAASPITVSVVTNQSAVGRGLLRRGDLDVVHEWLVGRMQDIGVDVTGVFVCPHAPDDGCGCRKPRPGLVRDAVAASGVAASSTLLVGDDVRDIEAAAAAGVAAALVATGKGDRAAASVSVDTPLYPDLVAVAAELTGRCGRCP